MGGYKITLVWYLVILGGQKFKIRPIRIRYINSRGLCYYDMFQFAAVSVMLVYITIFVCVRDGDLNYIKSMGRYYIMQHGPIVLSSEKQLKRKLIGVLKH